MPKAKPRKTRCPYCKKAHRCHNKCAAKRVGRRITKAGKPRAAKRVSYAIARGCSPRSGARIRKRKASTRSRSNKQRFESTRPRSGGRPLGDDKKKYVVLSDDARPRHFATLSAAETYARKHVNSAIDRSR